MTIRIENINSNMLRWAVDRAGYNADDYIEQNDKLKSWIDGTKKPTMRQLEEFANRMHVPFGYLFLNTPPCESIPIPLFRGSSVAQNMNLNVYDTVLSIQSRQEWLEDYMQSIEHAELEFVDSMTIADGVSRVVQKIRILLELKEDWALSTRDAADAVNKLTEQMENIGVVTTFNGVVGNNTHRVLSVEECRGFSLVSKWAPFIFVNNADAKSAQLFTLIHEFAHILLGVSAGFGGLEDAFHDVTEKFCDQVSAEFLLSSNLFRQKWSESDRNIDVCSHWFKVSRLVVARRAYAFSLITSTEYQEFYTDYINSWAVRKKSKSNGGSFYANAIKRVGRLFGSHINSAVNNGYLLHLDAYRLTGRSDERKYGR